MATENETMFRCAECGGGVRLASGEGRMREYLAGVRLPIPDDFLLPTCSACGETYESPEISSRLDALQAKQLLCVLCPTHAL